jgi:curved DNA-binding protein CbpA
LKNYYFILGLHIYATESEIKQAYRKLALQFHPDRNSSAEAESIFKEINEAYEILGDSGSKATYDLLLRGVSPAAPTETRPHRDPRYKPRPPGSFSRKSKKQELLEVMNDYLKYALMASRVALLFSIFLMTDLLLPMKKEERQVLYTSYRNEYRSSRSMQLNLKNDVVISLSKKDALQFTQGSKVFVYRSSLFEVPVRVENEKTRFIAKVPVSIYGNFIFCPIVMLITSLFGSFYWKGVEFRFNLGVVNFFLTLLSFLFLRIHFF